MASTIAVVLYLLPGALIAFRLHHKGDNPWSVSLLGTAFVWSTSLFVVVGIVAASRGVFSGWPVYFVAVAVAVALAAAGVLIGWGQAWRRALTVAGQFRQWIYLAPIVAVGAIRWFVFEARSRYPLGWDAGINYDFLVYLLRTGSFPDHRLGEAVANNYYQGIFAPIGVLEALSSNSAFSDMKLFAVVALIGLLAVAAATADRLLGGTHSSRWALVAAAVPAGTFLISSSHLAMIVGLALGLHVVVVLLDRRHLIASLPAWGALVAVHPPTVQFVAFVVAGLGAARWGARRYAQLRHLVMASAVGVAVAVVFHWLVLPDLSRGLIEYAQIQNEAIATGNLGVNANVPAGAVRQSAVPLVLWLAPGPVLGLIGVGLARLVKHRSIDALMIVLALTVPAIVKLSPTNGREYLLLLLPGMLLAASGVVWFGEADRAHRFAGLAVPALVVGMIALGIGRAHTVATDPAVSATAYLSDAVVATAVAIAEEAGPDALVAARYHPGVIYADAVGDAKIVGGFRGLGPGRQGDDIEDLIDAGPRAPVTGEAACTYSLTHVYVGLRDPAASQWLGAADAIRVGSGVLVPVECPA